jgi:type I restriction enzyme S subunit
MNSDYLIPLIGASSIMGYVKDYNYNEPVIVIGRVGTHGVIQRFNKKIWASDNTLVIRPKYYEYVYQLLRSIDYNSLNRGSTQPLITQTDVKNVRIIMPCKYSLENYEIIVGQIFNLAENNSYENDTLTSIRNTLLPKLMSGEIRVPIKSGSEIS